VSLPLRSHELLTSSVATGSLERGHEDPLLLGDVRDILLTVEVAEVVRLIAVDLVEYLGDGRPPCGPVRAEDLCVRRPRNRPGGPSSVASSRESWNSPHERGPKVEIL
jgi:hypothetical protein